MPDNAAMTTKTLLLVDGSSYLYRAYHALPDLRSPDGFPTGAIHGMVAMLKRALQDVNPEHAACVFDAKGDTFRNAWYQRPGYSQELRDRGVSTRDLDLLLVPWTDAAQADDVDYFAPRIAGAAGLKVSPHPPSVRMHGRKTWTLLFPGFADARWVDLSVLTPNAKVTG